MYVLCKLLLLASSSCDILRSNLNTFTFVPKTFIMSIFIILPYNKYTGTTTISLHTISINANCKYMVK